jgi:hypothetical protein
LFYSKIFAEGILLPMQMHGREVKLWNILLVVHFIFVQKLHVC